MRIAFGLGFLLVIRIGEEDTNRFASKLLSIHYLANFCTKQQDVVFIDLTFSSEFCLIRKLLTCWAVTPVSHLDIIVLII